MHSTIDTAKVTIAICTYKHYSQLMNAMRSRRIIIEGGKVTLNLVASIRKLAFSLWPKLALSKEKQDQPQNEQ